MHNSNTACIHKQKIKNRPKIANITNACNIYNSQPTVDGYVLISNNLTNIYDVNSKCQQTNVEVELNCCAQGIQLLNPDAETFVPNVGDISVDVVNVANNSCNHDCSQLRSTTITCTQGNGNQNNNDGFHDAYTVINNLRIGKSNNCTFKYIRANEGPFMNKDLRKEVQIEE